MKPEVPDVLGWELPVAIDACQSSGIKVSVTITQPPQHTHQNTAATDDSTEDDLLYRVVSVKPAGEGSIILVAAAEVW